MAKFIIGSDAFSDPESPDEKEYIVHTEFPRFAAEIVFVSSDSEYGFDVESLRMVWSEPCEGAEMVTAKKAALEAIDFYVDKSMNIED